MNSTDDLKKLLGTWEVAPEIPRRFQADVWARIAARENARPRLGNNFLRNCLADFLFKPQFAAAGITLCLALSVSAAYVRAQDSNATAGRQLEARYMASINPLAHATHSL